MEKLLWRMKTRMGIWILTEPTRLGAKVGTEAVEPRRI
jgi:hypothetical protein